MICSVCHGGCCRRYYVDITGYDILNISKTLMMDIPVFVDIVSIDEDQIDFYKEESVLFKFTDDNCEKYYRFCLKKSESVVYPDTQKCMFLQEWNANTLNYPEMEDTIIARCGIYGCRPLMCATYPAKYDLSGNFGYIPDPYTSCEKKSHPALNLCPRSVTSEDFKGCADETIKNLALQAYEMKFFRAMAEYWNNEPKSVNEFYNFIQKVYSNRVSCEET